MKKFIQYATLIIIFLFTLSITICLAQQKVIPPEKSDRTTSNRDFLKYLARIELGLGYGKHKVGEIEVTGLAVPMDVCLGIGIFPGTYIHGAFGVTIMDRPTFTLINETYEATVSMFDVGGGFTVYPLQQKAYASFTIYATTTAQFVSEDVYTSNVGVALNIKGGYDLMLGSAFSVGVSAFIYYASMNDKVDEYGNQAKINNSVIGLCLTATLGNL